MTNILDEMRAVVSLASKALIRTNSPVKVEIAKELKGSFSKLINHIEQQDMAMQALISQQPPNKEDKP